MKLLIISLVGAVTLGASDTRPVACTRPGPKGLPNAFFAMGTATKDENHKTYKSQAKMLKELGYAGWAPSAAENIPEMLKAVDANGLKMFAVYIMANVDPDQPKYNVKLKKTIAALKGRQTMIWVCLLGKAFKPASEDGDARALAIIDEVAGLAEDAGLRVALYPHVGFYMATIDDCVRLARKSHRRNVGVTFNLCHWLRLEHKKDIEPSLKQALPHLLLVTINGADYEGDWDRLIRPLGQGEFDMYGFLKMLKRLGYKGPIGFQGYGLKGDVSKHLKASMQAWQAYSDRLAAEEGR